MVSVIILAGGLGTRLRSIVSDRPKSMAQINGVPFLEYQIKYFKNQNLTDFIICSGYKHQKILNYFGDGYDNSIKIRHSVEKEPLGTGGAIKNALDMLNDQFFVVNGDTITEVNLNDLRTFHTRNNADLTMGLVKLEKNTRYGNVVTDKDGRITMFSEKIPLGPGFINTGIYFLNKDSIDWNSMPNTFSLEKDAFPITIREKSVFGYKVEGYFIDMGIPEDFLRFQKDIPLLNWLKGF